MVAIHFAFVFPNNLDVILVTNIDEVYCIGPNEDGCLGLGHDQDIKQLTRNEHLSKKKITKVQSYFYDAIFCLTLDGHVYGWGTNSCGQVGLGTKNVVRIPKLIGEQSVVFSDIKSGLFATMGLTKDGHVYLWGNNKYGQIYKSDQGGCKPTRIPSLDRVKSIECTATTSFAVREDGKIFAWGDNSCGQLCMGHYNPVHLLKSNDFLKTTSIDALTKFKVKKLTCGSFHVLMLDEDGHLFSWGCNDWGQLGDGSQKNRNIIYKINVKGVVNDCLAVGYRSFYIHQDGDIYLLGQHKEKHLLVPTKVPQRNPENIEENMNEFNYNGFTFRQISSNDESLKIKEMVAQRSKGPKVTLIEDEEMDDEQGTDEVDDDHHECFKINIQLFKSQLFSEGLFDITLDIEGQEINAHKVILSLYSRKFKNLFKENNGSNQLCLNGIKFEVIKSMIDFIYGKDFRLDLAEDLFIAAHDYGIEDLFKAAEIQLIKQLKPENAFKYSILGGKYNSSSLQDAALNYVFSGTNSNETVNLYKQNLQNIITQINGNLTRINGNLTQINGN